MPRYQFTGFDEMVLMGLSHGVNAELHREEHGQPDGSTVVALPGDEITTAEPYPHAWMVNTETGSPDWPTVVEATVKPARPRRPRAPRAPRGESTPPEADPAAQNAHPLGEE